MKRHTLGTFICGLAGYLDDFGKWVKGKPETHPAFFANDHESGTSTHRQRSECE